MNVHVRVVIERESPLRGYGCGGVLRADTGTATPDLYRLINSHSRYSSSRCCHTTFVEHGPTHRVRLTKSSEMQSTLVLGVAESLFQYSLVILVFLPSQQHK